MRRAFAAVGILGCLVSYTLAAPTPAPAATSIDGLVEQLAAPAYADREAAGRELLKVGYPALAALEKAVATNPDPEARQRAGTLLTQIKRTLDTTRHLPVQTVKLDYNNVPLGTALADLKAKTGIPLVLDQQNVSNPLRPITLRTEEVPAWAAVDAFCAAAGLKEVFREELGGQALAVNPYGNRRSGYGVPVQPSSETAGQVPVVLTDGKAEFLPGDRASSVRVLAMPAGFSGNKVVRGSGQIIVNLDVTPLPSVKWEDVSAVKILRALDETGRPVTISQRSESLGGNAAFSPDGNVVFWGGGPAQQAMMWNGDMGYNLGGTATRPNPRIVPVALRTDDRSIKMLKVFEGVVVGEVTLTNQTLATIDDLSKSVGTTVHAANDTRVMLLGYKTETAGQVTVKVRVDSPNPYTFQRMNRRINLNMVNGFDADLLRPNGSGNQIKFLDADGKILPQPGTRSSSGSDDGIRQVNETEYVFHNRPNLKLPTKIQLVGNKSIAVEIPFKMQNVPLP